MPKHYVTFGQSHVHYVQGKILDADTVAVFETENSTTGRNKAFELFGSKFFTDYHDKEWNEDTLHYFPDGYIELE